MSNAITQWRMYKKSTPFTTPSGTTEGTLIVTRPGIPEFPNHPRSLDDSSSPPQYYRLIGDTSDGWPIPYNDQQVTSDPPGTLKWARGVFGTATSLPAIARDGFGNFVVCWNTAQSCYLSKYSNDGAVIANWPIIVASSYGYAIGKGVAGDASGNVYVVSGVNDGTGIVRGVNFISKYGPDASLSWNKEGILGVSSGIADARCIVIDGNGDLIVAGRFFTDSGGYLDFGDGVHRTSSVSSQYDGFLIKYHPDGSVAHFVSFPAGGSYSTGVQPNSVGVDSANNIYLVGDLIGTTNFGGGSVSGTPSPFVAKFDLNLVHKWSVVFNASNSRGSFAKALVVKPNGEFVLGGYSISTLDLGGGQMDSSTSYGLGWIGKFDGSPLSVGPVFQWQKRLASKNSEGSDGVARIWGVTVDATGVIFVTGYLYGTFNFGAQTLTVRGLATSGNSDIVVARFNDSGSFGINVWAKSIGSSLYNAADFGRQIVMDAPTTSANPVIAGFYSNDVSADAPGTPYDGPDVLIAKFAG